MKDTYQESISRVLEDEGGYSDDVGDPGGPTNWGITIGDARHYWKANATPMDVKNMPKSVAEAIYAAHYAIPIHYDDLPPGIDYAVFDYGINSGIYRAAHTLQQYAHVTSDGVIGPDTVAAVLKVDSPKLISDIYDSRLRFLMGLNTWHIFGGGWGRRVRTGKTAAIHMWNEHKDAWIKLKGGVN
jgi:lysozyme family protein